MRVLVTGGAGYVGSVSVERLVEAGHEVVVLDDLSTGHRESVPDVASLAVGSYGDPVEMGRLLEGAGVDAILHCARPLARRRVRPRAGALLPRERRGWPRRSSMPRARLASTRLVFSSTAATYGIPATTPIPETAPLAPINPYGETKRGFEGALRFYGEAYGLRSVSLRYFNVAGATERNGELHDPETHLIPNVLRAVETGPAVHHLRRGLSDARRDLHPRLHPRRRPGRRAPAGARGDRRRREGRRRTGRGLQPRHRPRIQRPGGRRRVRGGRRPVDPFDDRAPPRRRPAGARRRRGSRGERARLDGRPAVPGGDDRFRLGVAPPAPGSGDRVARLLDRREPRRRLRDARAARWIPLRIRTTAEPTWTRMVMTRRAVTASVSITVAPTSIATRTAYTTPNGNNERMKRSTRTPGGRWPDISAARSARSSAPGEVVERPAERDGGPARRGHGTERTADPGAACRTAARLDGDIGRRHARIIGTASARVSWPTEMIANDALTAASTWRPQLFGDRRAANVVNPIVEPLWTGPRILAYVSGGGDPAHGHRRRPDRGARRHPGAARRGRGGSTLLIEAALTPEPLQGPADLAARETAASMPKTEHVR